MKLKLENKTVLVTAASKGIGKATAKLFASEGANVVICSRSKDNLKTAAEEIEKTTGLQPLTVTCNLNDEMEIPNVVKTVEEKLGTIDVLVNNCGGPPTGTLESLKDEEWQKAHLQVLLSAKLFAELVLPKMKEKKWGRIINVTSISVKQPIDNLLLSNVYRSGLTALAKTLANEYGEYGITVNNVAPGYTLTERLYNLAKEKANLQNRSVEVVLKEFAGNIPLKRLGKPEEIASTIVFLASENAGFINGVTINVDGGEYKGLI